MGRRPLPFEVIRGQNGRVRKTKAELDAREAAEPRLPVSDMKCPRTLSADARKEWHKITKLYLEMENQVITDLDLSALEVFCENLVIWRKAMRKLQESSEVYSIKGDPQPRVNPWLLVADKAAANMRKYGEVLLLDPVSRARIGMAKSKEEDLDPMSVFLSKRGGNGV